MPVSHLGPQDAVTVSTDATVADVVDRLEEENVGSVVVTREGEPAGIVTDRDVALSVTRGDDVAGKPVTDVMTEDPSILPEDAPDMEVSRAIGEHEARRIPVVDEEGKLTGIVTLDDLVATIGEQLDHVSDTIEMQSPGYQP